MEGEEVAMEQCACHGHPQEHLQHTVQLSVSGRERENVRETREGEEGERKREKGRGREGEGERKRERGKGLSLIHI